MQPAEVVTTTAAGETRLMYTHTHTPHYVCPQGYWHRLWGTHTTHIPVMVKTGRLTGRIIHRDMMSTSTSPLQRTTHTITHLKDWASPAVYSAQTELISSCYAPVGHHNMYEWFICNYSDNQVPVSVLMKWKCKNVLVPASWMWLCCVSVSCQCTVTYLWVLNCWWDTTGHLKLFSDGLQTNHETNPEINWQWK